MTANAKPIAPEGRAGIRAARGVVAGGETVMGEVVTGGREGAVVVTAPGVFSGVVSEVNGGINCDREKPYTADPSTAAMREPSALTATEWDLIGLEAVEDPSFVPARSYTERDLSKLPAAIVLPSSETATLVTQ